ncbi:DUF6119 family protein [Thalassospira alkalitolerans]|uniref:DUF6119 family protein n=1 Tax=Thalassospira alkalitolerans TaxID=1293890 RepID=UPI003AA9BCFE
MAKLTFTLYLVKSEIENFEDTLTETARGKIRFSKELPLYGEGGKLFVFQGHEQVPVWYKRLAHHFEIGFEIGTKSSSAVLIFKAAGRVFACTFAFGWMYLDDRKLEADFGLRAAINALDDKRLQKLERANLSDAIRGMELSPFKRDLNSFGLEAALNLVRRVGGDALEDSAAETMSGAQSLKLTGEFELSDLPALAEEALELFGAEFYKKTSFVALDVIRPIRDKGVVDILDQQTVQHIKDQLGDFEFGLPITLADESIMYSFQGPNLKGGYPDLRLSDYLEALGDKVEELSTDMLKKHKVIALFQEEDRPNRTWSLRQSLVGSLIHEDGLYALNEGEWYRLDQAFQKDVVQVFDTAHRNWAGVPRPRPLKGIYGGNGDGVYEAEGDYNASIGKELDYVVFDTVMIKVPSVPNSGFEVCDLLDIKGRRLIHVKKSSRRSSVLSHFFKQGSNSARNIKCFPLVRQAMVQYVRENYGDDKADQLHSAIFDENEKWTVEYWIADRPRANNEFSIPFFSKATFSEESRYILTMNYDVVVRFISLH